MVKSQCPGFLKMSTIPVQPSYIVLIKLYKNAILCVFLKNATEIKIPNLFVWKPDPHKNLISCISYHEMMYYQNKKGLKNTDTFFYASQHKVHEVRS